MLENHEDAATAINLKKVLFKKMNNTKNLIFQIYLHFQYYTYTCYPNQSKLLCAKIISNADSNLSEGILLTSIQMLSLRILVGGYGDGATSKLN
ncbi:hypothetical protein EAH57_07185 [Acinetobacter sp. 2JN-4]|nr:hypothetical protein EAH57_07185 [Acinetobacter sp. 2JN-4]